MTDRQITHAPGCWGWGPRHYECALREIELLAAQLTAAQQRGQAAPPSAPAGVEDMQRRLDREESDHARTIDQRDAAEDALGRMFQAVTGRTAEWSSAWGYLDAIEEVEEHVATLATERDQLAAALEAAREDAYVALVVDIRLACGDNGKRSQPELVEYIRELTRDAERYRWLRQGESDAIATIKADTLDAVIDAAMQRTSGGDHG
ncbi:hypothetical protein [Caldimonas thermodepolymerans]|uniref:Uncharacterized protein n=1 Tax=Caldimonas thermodepolymerans TaxID=215580 RepID=A0AA46DDS3_9BURK|nr:hypothetical protein [Caldimonas thermodepolymerans]TCP06595.1 hypothetical protein EV676_10678 [Caldimonas thermodepolymerans]UZG49349.1 hypothetical protein ONS87_06940 [Caldimonas thermodepolymerans]